MTASPSHDDTTPANQDLFYQAFGSDDRAFLAARVHRRRYQVGSMIFRAGDPGDSLLGVLRGTVRISLPTRGGKDLILTDLPAGEIFGEIGLLDDRGRSADASALTNVELAVLGRADAFEFFARRPEAYRKLIALVSKRLRSADERTSDLAFSRLELRLAKVVLRWPEAARGVARLSITQGDLAHLAVCSREALNRQLADWRKRGLVELQDGWIVLCNVDAIRSIAEGN